MSPKARILEGDCTTGAVLVRGLIVDEVVADVPWEVGPGWRGSLTWSGRVSSPPLCFLATRS